MKYWNKDKDIRQRCWTKVVVGPNTVGDNVLTRWCQQQSSNGKFYKYYGSSTWWFERSDDAVFFLLRWS